MKLRPLVAAGLLAPLCVIPQLPASLMGEMLASQCQQRCRLALSEGSLWAGQGELYLRAGPNAPWQATGLLHWRGQWQNGLPGLKIKLGGGEIDALLDSDGVQIRLHDIALPANALLSQLGDKFPQTGWQGWIGLPQGQLSLKRDGRWHSQGEIHWRNARTRLLEDAPLGDWQLHWQRPNDQALQGQLNTQGGELTLQGQLNWPGPGQAVQFDGQANATQGGPLEKYLRAVGVRGRDCGGCYRLHWPK